MTQEEQATFDDLKKRKERLHIMLQLREGELSAVQFQLSGEKTFDMPIAELTRLLNTVRALEWAIPPLRNACAEAEMTFLSRFLEKPEDEA